MIVEKKEFRIEKEKAISQYIRNQKMMMRMITIKKIWMNVAIFQ